MRYRLNLDAPFLDAGSLDRQPSSKNQFRRATANDVAASESVDADACLRRPSPRNRAKGVDYSGETMARYISGLEARMTAHFRKHAPDWHRKETQKILRRWSAPQPKAPAPRWAPPIDRQAEAQDYAAALLRERLRARMHRIGDIRIARTLGGHGQVDPLHLIFHDRSTVFKNKNRQKI